MTGKRLVDKPVLSGTPDRKMFEPTPATKAKDGFVPTNEGLELPDEPPARAAAAKAPAPPAFICCAVCLNMTSARVPMATIVAGYAVCAGHVELASQPGFNIFKLRPTGRSV